MVEAMKDEITKSNIDTGKYRKGKWELRRPDNFLKLSTVYVCVPVSVYQYSITGKRLERPRSISYFQVT